MQFMNKLISYGNQILQTLQISNNNFIGMFLFGSQNYGLDNSKSDFDFIMIVGHNDKAMIEHQTSIGVVKIFTLEHFINQLKFGDLRCYEALYTKYKIINELYAECFEQFAKDFSVCMNYERIKFALRKKIDEHMCYVLWLLTNKEKARYNKKRLYWAIRSWNQLCRISCGESFKDSMVYKPLIDYDLLSIKTIVNYLSPKEFNNIYKQLIEVANSQFHYNTALLKEEEQCLIKLYKDIHIIKKGVDGE